MEYRKLGQSELEISEVSLGCWVTGGDYWGGAEDKESIYTIQEAIDKGINMIDTAELYGWGHSEKVIGEAIKGRRDKVYISSKVWKTNMAPKALRKACEDSMRRLGTDYIDIYFMHYPNEDGVPIEETMGEMVKLQEEGKIRALGLSNFTVEHIKQVSKIGRIDVMQPCFSLLWRHPQKDVIPYCAENNIGVVAYSPLAQGLLTGKFDENTKFPKDDGRSRAPMFQSGVYEKCLEVEEIIEEYAKKYDKTPGQIAINWVTSTKGMTSAIVGARNRKQLRQNVNAAGWRLSEDDYNQIDKLASKITDTIPEFVNFFKNKIKE